MRTLLSKKNHWETSAHRNFN